MLSRSMLFLVLMILSTVISAQDTEANSRRSPVTDIKDLRGGTLLIRLPSNQRKMTALQEAIDKNKSADGQSKWLKKELEATRSETESFNKNMFLAFQESYTFSEIRFTYDYFTPELKAGNFKCHLLNENLEPDASLTIPNKPVYILSFGRTNKEYSDGVEAMVVMNGELKSPPPPFPYYQRLNDFQAFWGNLFPRPDQEIYDANRLVSKFNKKLFKFYNRNVSATDLYPQP